MNNIDSLSLLPGDIGDIETKVVLKKLTKAHRALAELKGVANSIPNQAILINTLSLQEDPLTKMAIIHHQFESIHPFYDGNGRTGRIINVLYFNIYEPPRHQGTKGENLNL